MTHPTAIRAYRAGVAIAVLTALLTVWTTIVRDDGLGIGFFLVIMAAAVGAFAAWFTPAGMARTMLGVAAMQGAFMLAFATAPSTALLPDGGARVLVAGVVAMALWLVSAGCFWMAARGEAAAV